MFREPRTNDLTRCHSLPMHDSLCRHCQPVLSATIIVWNSKLLGLLSDFVNRTSLAVGGLRGNMLWSKLRLFESV